MTLSEELEERLSAADAPRRERMSLISWKSVRSGNLKGFASVWLPIGLRVYDCPVMNGTKGLFASLPSRPQLDREGQKRTNPQGRVIYEEMLVWDSKKLKDAFSERVVALVQAHYPADLE